MMSLRRVLPVVVGCLVLSGCSGTIGGTGVQDITLPGGADLGSHPYTVRADFADVLDLVPQAAVKVNDVAVGRVTRISLTGTQRGGHWAARVTMLVNGRVKLPANAVAHLEQSSLLGEKYVQLAPPPAPEPRMGDLSGGAVIPIARTTRNPEVEEVFGALSMLLNGGGLPQIRVITRELDHALNGREPEIRDVLGRLSTLTTTLNDRRTDITGALDAINRLSVTLRARRPEIDTALGDLTPGLKVIDDERTQLVTMLGKIEDLSGVATDILRRSSADTVEDLRALAPTLTELANAGKTLPESLQVLLTFPYTDQILQDVRGDYVNTFGEVTAVPGTCPINPMISPNDPKVAQRLRQLQEKARKGESATSADGQCASAGPSGSAGSPGSSGSSGSAQNLPLPSAGAGPTSSPDGSILPPLTGGGH